MPSVSANRADTAAFPEILAFSVTQLDTCLLRQVAVPAGSVGLGYDSPLAVRQYVFGTYSGDVTNFLSVVGNGGAADDRIFIVDQPVFIKINPAILRNIVSVQFIGQDVFQPFCMVPFPDKKTCKVVRGGELHAVPPARLLTSRSTSEGSDGASRRGAWQSALADRVRTRRLDDTPPMSDCIDFKITLFTRTQIIYEFYGEVVIGNACCAVVSGEVCACRGVYRAFGWGFFAPNCRR